ncbi:unnamed protein product, partial [marine sediment metagenome]
NTIQIQTEIFTRHKTLTLLIGSYEEKDLQAETREYYQASKGYKNIKQWQTLK